MKNLHKKILGVAMATLTAFSSFVMTPLSVSAADDENVVINVASSPRMDIVLTQTDMGVDVSNFEKDVRDKLATYGIDTKNSELINITAVETTKADLQSSFTWLQDKSATIGTINTTSNGVDMKGNQKYAGKNAVYCMPTQEGNIFDYSYNYSINFGDSFNAAGMLLNVKENGNYLDGYMLSFNNRGTFKSVAGTNAALWKVRWQKGTNTSNIVCSASTGTPNANQAFLVSKLAINTSGTLNVKAESDKITVSGGGLAETVINIDKTWGDNGFGFFSDHYSHGCSNIGQFNLTNISMNITTIKEYTDILSQPAWREDAYHFIVNVDNTTTIFDNANIRANTLSRTMNDDIYFIDWGTASTKAKAEQFIKDNNNKGIFVLSSNYTDAVTATANLIASQTLKESNTESSEEYVIVGENVNLLVNPESFKTNTANSEWPNGKWFINHDYKYFANNQGLSSQTQTYSSDLLLNFDKPGKYDIYYCDNLIKTIYAHRKPVADFTVNFDNANVVLSSQSYDLDNNTNNGFGKGIAKETWSYMAMGDNAWTEGKLATAQSGTTYIIKLEVEDIQGATNYATKYIGIGDPVASFLADTTQFSKYHNLVLTDTSYDPSKYAIDGWQWTLKKNRNVVGTYTVKSPSIDFVTLGTGTYTLSLKVKNTQGAWSEEYSRTLTVIDDLTPPSVTIDPSSSDWTDSVDIHIEIEDADSGLKHWRYVYTQSQDKPADSAFGAWQTKDNETLTFNTDGEYYLHFEAYDNAGNKLERTIGTYKVTHPYTNKISHNFGILNKTEFKDYDWGKKYSPTEVYNEKVNGFELKDTFMANYPTAGTIYNKEDKLKQPSGAVEYNISYQPTVYTATIDYGYDEKIETKDFTVLEGFKLEAPTREGYDFTGWVVNGKLLDNVNYNVNNNFDSFEEFAKSMRTRTAEDLTFTATWGQAEFVEGTNVFAQIASEYKVTIPKTVVLSGKTKDARYTVKVEGDIAGYENIEVIPDETFGLRTTGKDIQQASVEQDKTMWKVADFEVDGNGTITASGITAGKWTGSFNFNIAFNTPDEEIVNSEEYIEYTTINYPQSENVR